MQPVLFLICFAQLLFLKFADAFYSKIFHGCIFLIEHILKKQNRFFSWIALIKLLFNVLSNPNLHDIFSFLFLLLSGVLLTILLPLFFIPIHPLIIQTLFFFYSIFILQNFPFNLSVSRYLNKSSIFALTSPIL